MKNHKHNHIFRSEQLIQKDLPTVFQFFSDAKNLEKITPKWMHFHIVQMSTPTIQKGTLIDYRLKVKGIPMKWRTEIAEWEPNARFVDTQLIGPYSFWHHTHSFEPAANGSTLMKDEVIYRIPLGILGKTFLSPLIKRDIQEIFSYRRKIIDKLFN